PHLRADERECVLDYVVERKRLDDLCGSIRDGRYDEQKVSRLNRVPRSIFVLICGLPYQFRLNNSCLRNVYYIVEQWNIAGYLGPADSGNTTAQAVATARSQTQVTDGFFVKDTHKLSETVEYLRLLTEIIVETHQVGNVQFEIDGEALTVLERMLRCMSSRLVTSREETTTTFKVTFANVTPQHHITPHWTPTNHLTRRPQIVR
nr:ERCC4 domain-containing protein [Leuconostoc sp.]